VIIRKGRRIRNSNARVPGGGAVFRESLARVKIPAIRLRTEMLGRSVLAEPLNSLSLNRLSAHRDGFALPSE
jgi:hypothetical protein